MIRLFRLYTFKTPPKEDLSADDVRAILERRFAAEGKAGRAVGAIRERDARRFAVEIVDSSGVVTRRLLVDRHTGAWETDQAEDGGPGMRATARGRRLSHGPIDLAIEAFGSERETDSAYVQAELAFAGLLEALEAELALLRAPVGPDTPAPEGPVARRMVAACRPFADGVTTPMAAVAGAVADHMLGAMLAGRRLERAYVNNGGDIALHLAPERAFEAGLPDGRVVRITAEMPVRGVSTSGAGGHSASLGIADAVTVFAATAAAADIAVTLIANAVDVDDAAIVRAPANSLDAASDLGRRLVTVEVGALGQDAIARALDAGAALARELCAAGRIHGAVLSLRGRERIVGPLAPSTPEPAA